MEMLNFVGVFPLQGGGGRFVLINIVLFRRFSGINQLLKALV